MGIPVVPSRQVIYSHINCKPMDLCQRLLLLHGAVLYSYVAFYRQDISRVWLQIDWIFRAEDSPVEDGSNCLRYRWFSPRLL